MLRVNKAAAAPFRHPDMSMIGQPVAMPIPAEMAERHDDFGLPLLNGPLTMFGLDLEGADHGTEAARA